MKRMIIVIFLLFPNILFCQTVSRIQYQIDSIESINDQLKKNIEKNINFIVALQSKILQVKASHEKISPFYYKLEERIKILKEKFVLGEILTWVDKGDSILILNYDSDYLVIKYNDIVGYSHFNTFQFNTFPKMTALYNFKESALLVQLNNETNPLKGAKIQEQLNLLHKSMKENAEAAELATKIEQKLRKQNELIQEQEAIRIKEEKKQKIIQEQREKKRQEIQMQNETARRERIIQKYGQIDGQKIIEKKIWIGMSSEMARESWGLPNDINRTVNQYSISEQWVYNSAYLYFDNGFLTSWQD